MHEGLGAPTAGADGRRSPPSLPVTSSGGGSVRARVICCKTQNLSSMIMWKPPHGAKQPALLSVSMATGGKLAADCSTSGSLWAVDCLLDSGSSHCALWASAPWCGGVGSAAAGEQRRKGWAPPAIPCSFLWVADMQEHMRGRGRRSFRLTRATHCTLRSHTRLVDTEWLLPDATFVLLCSSPGLNCEDLRPTRTGPRVPLRTSELSHEAPNLDSKFGALRITYTIFGVGKHGQVRMEGVRVADTYRSLIRTQRSYCCVLGVTTALQRYSRLFAGWAAAVLWPSSPPAAATLRSLQTGLGK